MAIDFAELQKTWFWTIIGPSFWLASAMNGTLLQTLRLCLFTAVNQIFCWFHYQACHSGTSVLVRFHFLFLQTSIGFGADALECNACPHLRTSGSSQLRCFSCSFFLLFCYIIFMKKRQKACFGQPVQHFSTFLTPRTLLAELFFTPFWKRYFDDSSMFWVLFALFLNSKPLFSLPGAVNPSFDIFWTHLFSRFFKLARRLFSLPGAVFEWNWTLSESHFSKYFFMTPF